MSKLLYYPKMSIPNNTWLTHALLYWDGVATIVPHSELSKTGRLTSFARQLISDGIIETIEPEEYAFSHPDKYLEFLYMVKENRELFSFSQNRYSYQNIKQYNVHIGKLGYIGSELEEMGLAKRIDGHWYAMERKLSESFMTFLAVLISLDTDRIPTTDSFYGMSSLFNVDFGVHTKNARVVKNNLRNTILEGLLPVPSYTQDYRRLMCFKEKYHDELIRFRQYVEDFILSLEGSPVEVQEKRCKNFLAASQDEIDYIKGHMGFLHAPRINMYTLVPALPSAIELLQGNIPTVTSLLTVVSGMVLNQNREVNRKKPIAYAALYQRNYGSK